MLNQGFHAGAAIFERFRPLGRKRGQVLRQQSICGNTARTGVSVNGIGLDWDQWGRTRLIRASSEINRVRPR